jgi:predicted helicase
MSVAVFQEIVARALSSDSASGISLERPRSISSIRRSTSASRVVDNETMLEGVPAEAWEYRLGNRSALEWVLDQYKESTPKDPTIREKFNTYRFADYKEKVIDLLARVTTVSVETQRIVEEMKKAPR